MVRADAHRHAARFAQFHQRREALTNAAQLCDILLIGVFDDLELLRVRVVPRIDAHLLHPFCRFHRRFGLEVNVRHDRHITAAITQTFDDMLQVRRILHSWCRDAHDLTAHVH